MFDKVEFVELDLEESKKLVQQYNKEGQAALPPPEKRFRGNREYTSRFSGRFLLFASISQVLFRVNLLKCALNWCLTLDGTRLVT